MPAQLAQLGVILSLVVMAVNLSVAWVASSARRAFTPGGTVEHLSTGVLGLVFVGLGLRVVFAG
jgi:threonine/homoserine/homoserine lactone efflux protein